MATFTIEQIQTKQQNLQQINNTLQEMINWLGNYNLFLVSGWSSGVEGTNINYSLTAKDQADFQGNWEKLITKLLLQINSFQHNL